MFTINYAFIINVVATADAAKGSRGQPDVATIGKI